MGCCASKDAARVRVIQNKRAGVSFGAFISHYKHEAATEARWLKDMMQQHGLTAFLDSDGKQYRFFLHQR